MSLLERIGGWLRREPPGTLRVRVVLKGRIGDGWFDVDQRIALPAGATLATLIEQADQRGLHLSHAIAQSPHLRHTLMWNGQRAPVDENLGRPLLDATNPVKAGFALDVGPGGESGAERTQALVPNAHVVKVFNTTGAENIRDPSYAGAATVMFYAGNDIGAKRVAHELASTLGFDPVDAGVLMRARELEHLAALWIALANGATGAPPLGRNIAFRLVRR